jgi:hypothetical protein
MPTSNEPNLLVQQVMKSKIHYAVSMLHVLWNFDMYDLIVIVLFRFQYIYTFNENVYLTA